MTSSASNNTLDYTALASKIGQWAHELEFSDCAISDTRLNQHEKHFLNWLNDGFHGDMHYMQEHGSKRTRPAELEPGTQSVISVRLDYSPEVSARSLRILRERNTAYVSRYALGRDYHKMMRKRLQKLARKIQSEIGDFGFRAFVDSAPVLEKALAEKAGLGWIGKHSNLLTRKAGSWFFLGEIYTDLPLPPSKAKTQGHCGTCDTCITACPTQAIVAPYRVDARRCISYLTIEMRGSIPLALRDAIGNRIYGCDDCQLVCPWTRFTPLTTQDDFLPRHNLDQATLAELFQWSEQEFLQRMEGSAIRRIGYECWLRNIAVALGNAETTHSTLNALQVAHDHPSMLVREHVLWALDKHHAKLHPDTRS